MQWSPDVLTALRSSRRYRSSTEDDRQPQPQPQRTTSVRTVYRAAAMSNERSRPDYGCVDWFVYEEQRSEQESV